MAIRPLFNFAPSPTIKPASVAAAAATGLIGARTPLMPPPEKPRVPLMLLRSLLLGLVLLGLGPVTGCATIRTTDPPRTATEQFLLSGATRSAIAQLSADALRDRVVYIETEYLGSAASMSQDMAFLVGEFRSKLLKTGVRLTPTRDRADIVVEVLTGGVGIDRLEFLLGIPSVLIPTGATAGTVPLTTPELAIVKSTRQKGFASVSFVAYWKDTGELLNSSGPMVGRTYRDDWWFFGFGPKTEGDIAPAQRTGE